MTKLNEIVNLGDLWSYELRDAPVYYVIIGIDVKRQELCLEDIRLNKEYPGYGFSYFVEGFKDSRWKLVSRV
jgi:hypothetical protein